MNMPKEICSNDISLIFPENPAPEIVSEIYSAVMETMDLLKPWLPWATENYSLQDEINYLNDWCVAHWHENSGYAYLIRHNSDHKFLGMIDVVRADMKNKVAEIGYWLRKDAQGYGYMSQAVEALTNTCFAVGFNRVVIRNNTQNVRSVKVAERLGFHLDGVLRQDRWSDYFQEFTDTNVWSKLKSEA